MLLNVLCVCVMLSFGSLLSDVWVWMCVRVWWSLCGMCIVCGSDLLGV